MRAALVFEALRDRSQAESLGSDVEVRALLFGESGAELERRLPVTLCRRRKPG
eukprot:CAMPEP_0177697630 /NCGR_PEP_ID=MMETSP0484_2-20121128/4614_1 /TAXON_ID=354590 /ORGANISM="Rhodomonas lens, Strain RHODO" /LENGTH=52 /DNA_ID=CAMNT_0019208677 /DNA_START=244 /DNA_END=401 /DNA_ORIENTATION=-